MFGMLVSSMHAVVGALVGLERQQVGCYAHPYSPAFLTYSGRLSRGVTTLRQLVGREKLAPPIADCAQRHPGAGDVCSAQGCFSVLTMMITLRKS